MMYNITILYEVLYYKPGNICLLCEINLNISNPESLHRIDGILHIT